MSGPIVTSLPPRGVAIRRAPNTLRSTNTVLEQSLFPKHCGVDGGSPKHCIGTIYVLETLCTIVGCITILQEEHVKVRDSRIHKKNNFVEKSGLSSFSENKGAVEQRGLVEFSRVTSLTNALCAHITPAPLLLNLG